jgi:hypothetical protein
VLAPPTCGRPHEMRTVRRWANGTRTIAARVCAQENEATPVDRSNTGHAGGEGKTCLSLRNVAGNSRASRDRPRARRSHEPECNVPRVCADHTLCQRFPSRTARANAERARNFWLPGTGTVEGDQLTSLSTHEWCGGASGGLQPSRASALCVAPVRDAVRGDREALNDERGQSVGVRHPERRAPAKTLDLAGAESWSMQSCVDGRVPSWSLRASSWC